jgi:hypothetical protein
MAIIWRPSGKVRDCCWPPAVSGCFGNCTTYLTPMTTYLCFTKPKTWSPVCTNVKQNVYLCSKIPLLIMGCWRNRHHLLHLMRFKSWHKILPCLINTRYSYEIRGRLCMYIFYIPWKHFKLSICVLSLMLWQCRILHGLRIAFELFFNIFLFA